MIKATFAACAMIFTGLAGAAGAATIHATSAEIVSDGLRGTSHGRDDITNAFGAADGQFFELGYNAIVEFQFGTPTGKPFQGPGTLVEITFNNNPSWVEAVRIEVGTKGDAGSFVAADPNPFVNTANFANPVFSFSGIFDTVRLTDLTLNYASRGSSADTGGFDVDAISVTEAPGVRFSEVPLPAGGLLLVSGMGALVTLRRRRKST